MKHIDDSYRSRTHIVVIGDLFSYQIQEHRFDVVVSRVLDNIDTMLNNHALMDTLFGGDGIDSYDRIVMFKSIFDVKKIKCLIYEKQKEAMHVGIINIMKEILDDLVSVCHGATSIIEDQILLDTYRIILHEVTVDEVDDLWIKLNTFDVRFLYQLDDKILGFILPKACIKAHDLMIAKMLNIGLIEDIPIKPFEQDIRADAPYHMNDLNVYMEVAGNRHIKRINHSFYKGIFYHSEYDIILKGLMISDEEIYHMYSTLFSEVGHTPILMKIPTFTDHFNLMIDHTLKTEVNQFSFSHLGLKNWISGLAKAIQRYHPHLVFIIPQLNSKHDLDFWDHEINVLFMHLKHDYQVGMTIETEAALQYCEDFEKLEPAILLLDELMSEYSDKQNNKHIFHGELRFLIDDLKDAHTIFRLKQIKSHIISGEVLKDKNTLRKLINMGFKEFALTIDQLCDASTVFEKWEKSRGKYSKKKS